MMSSMLDIIRMIWMAMIKDPVMNQPFHNPCDACGEKDIKMILVIYLTPNFYSNKSIKNLIQGNFTQAHIPLCSQYYNWHGIGDHNNHSSLSSSDTMALSPHREHLATMVECTYHTQCHHA